MHTSFIHITPDRWVLISGIFWALSFFMPRRIPWIMAGTAFATGTISFIYPFVGGGSPLSTAMQLAIFSVLLILGLLFIQIATPSSHSSLKKADVLTLTSPIKKGKGTFKVGEKSYTLVGPDCPASTQVTVVSLQGDILYISPINPEGARHE